MTSQFYRGYLLKLSVAALFFGLIFWDVVTGKRNDSAAFMIWMGAALAAMYVLLFIGMRRAQRKEQLVADEMQHLEVVVGQSESQMVESLMVIGTDIEERLKALAPPFKVMSDAGGFSFSPWGKVRVVEIEGAKTLSRVVAKDGKIIQRTTMGS